MGLTTDRHDGCLHEVDPVTGLQQCYLILPDGERKSLVQPVRLSYTHTKCGTGTTMSRAIAETYAADPHFYDATFCATCRSHYSVGDEGEFVWDRDGTKVGATLAPCTDGGYAFVLDGREVRYPGRHVTGALIKRIGGCPSTYQLKRGAITEHDTQWISDGEKLNLAVGSPFFWCVPPASA